MRVGLIGLGNLGTAVGNLAAANGHEVLGWEHDAAIVDEVNDEHTNARYLPDVALDPRVSATTEVGAVFDACRIVFVAIPSVFVRPTLAAVAGDVAADHLVVNMAKGIDRGTGLTSFQMIGDVLPEVRRVMLSGPSIANEFARGEPTVVVVAGEQTNDLLATSLSAHSHNRRMGELLAQGRTLDDIRGIMGVLPEGFNTLRVILYVAEKMHLSMPLARGLLDVVNGRYAAEDFITSFIKDFVEYGDS